MGGLPYCDPVERSRLRQFNQTRVRLSISRAWFSLRGLAVVGRCKLRSVAVLKREKLSLVCKCVGTVAA